MKGQALPISKPPSPRRPSPLPRHLALVPIREPSSRNGSEKADPNWTNGRRDIRDQLQALVDRLIEDYAEESGVTEDTVLFSGGDVPDKPVSP